MKPLTSFAEREGGVCVPQLLDELDVAVVNDVAVLVLDVLEIVPYLLLETTRSGCYVV